MELVVMQNQQAVTSSLQVAGVFEKQHKDVLEAIDNKIQSAENSAHYKLMFAPGEYKDSRGRTQRMYYMNRDGFSFIAFGFTGRKADDFKLKYIEAFNKMENHIKQQLDTSNLSPELQFMSSVVQSLAKQELATKQLETKIDNISEIVALDSRDWRKKANSILRKIAFKQGGMDRFKEIGNESYERLENRAKCNLNIRLDNRKKNMIVQGAGKTAVKKLNKLDVIAEDARLTEIYLSVIKDMAIKYDVDFKEEA